MSSTQKLTELPEIQYTGMDYDSIMNQFQQMIKDNPKWNENWENFYSADGGTLLVQLMAYLADNLGFRQDMLYGEHFLATAKKDSSKANLLKQIGYYTSLAHASTIPVQLEFPKGITFSDDEPFVLNENGITVVTGRDTNGNSGANYEFLDIDASGKPDYKAELLLYPEDANDGIFTTYRLNGSSTKKELVVLEGKTNSRTFTSDTRDGPKFTLTESNIAADSIRIYDEDGKEHRHVDNFLDPKVRTAEKVSETVPSYIIERDENNNIVIRYPSEMIMTYDDEVLDEVEENGNTYHRMFVAGSTITVYYRTTNGSNGNIATGFINTSITVADSSANRTTINVYNHSDGYGGKDAETLEEAKETAPLSLKTMNRAVTIDDYDYLLNQCSLILKSKSFSPNNEPDDFAEKYGRSINPNEVYSFVVGNKNFSNVSSEDFDSYEWFELNKNEKLNNKIIFNQGKTNQSEAVTGNYGEYDLTYSDSETSENENDVSKINSSYTTASLLRTPDEVIESLKDDSKKEDVTIKLHKNNENDTFTKNVIMDLLGSDETYGSKIDGLIKIANNYVDEIKASKRDGLTYEYPIIKNNNAHAICTLAQSIEKEDVIDVYNYNLITFAIDKYNKIKIDLMQEKVDGVTYTNYYLMFSNDISTTIPSSVDVNSEEAAKYRSTTIPSSVDVNSEEAAKYRYGIIQLINQQVLATLKINAYETATKIFDGSRLNQRATISNTDLSNYSIMKINGILYAFDTSENAYETAINSLVDSNGEKNGDRLYYYVRANGLSIDTEKYFKIDDDYSFVEQEIKAGTNLDNDTYFTLNKLKEYGSTSATITEKLEKILSYEFMEGVSRVHTENLVMVQNEDGTWSNYSTTELSNYILNIITDINYNKENIDIDEGNSQKIIISKYTSSNEKIIEEVSDNITSVNDKSASKIAYDSLENVLKASYNNIASLISVTKEEAKNGNYNLILSSPLTGEDSTICIHKETSENYVTKYVSKIEFNNNISAVATGIKQLELVLQEVTSAISYDTAVDIPNYGDIIYKGNDVAYWYSTDNLYLSYIFDTDNSIYITENEYLDGTVIDTDNDGNKTINNKKSKYSVKLTKEEQNCNYGAISDNNDFGVIENKSTYIKTANVSTEIPVSTLIFTIDGVDDEISIDTTGINNIEALYTKIRDTLINKKSGDLYENEILPYYADNIVKLSNNSIILSGVDNSDDGCITFKYTDGCEELFKLLFGTNKTNINFYSLFTKEAMETIGNDKSIIKEIEDEYYYAPSDGHDLKFIYREFIAEDDSVVSKFGDYYIEEDTNGAKIVSTKYGEFPNIYFYAHYVNDKTITLDETQDDTEEDAVQDFMEDKKIAGTDIILMQPVFNTFDIAAEIIYNGSYSLSTIKSSVENKIDELFLLSSSNNISIGGSISKSTIYNEIMKINGVVGVNIKYFGRNYLDSTNYPNVSDEITADFNEVISLYTPDVKDSHGKIFTYTRYN